jgi:nucleoside-diphosphate-sugar epimerase
MLVAITGANGFLGRNLSSQLQIQGHSVRKLSRGRSSTNSSPVNYFSISSIEEALQNVDLLVHCGWAGVNSEQRSDPTLQNENVLIARNIASSMDNTGVKKIIALGSQDEFGEAMSPWSDLTLMSPTSAYGIAKRQVNEIFAETEKEFAWIRLFSTFGEGDLRDTIFLKVAKALKNNEMFELGSCKNLWANCHIDDIVTGITLAIDEEATGPINLAPLNATSLRSQIELLIVVERCPPRRERFTNWDGSRRLLLKMDLNGTGSGY